MEHTDRDLVDAARAGDFGAFERLVARHRDRVYRLAYGMTKNASDAEEVAQETFLGLYRGLDGFRGDASVSSWVYRVASNAALMRLRSRRRKPLLSVEDQPREVASSAAGLWPGGLGEGAEQRLLGDELRRHLEEAMLRLPEKYRIVLLLRDVEGRTNEETADALGLTVATVKSRLHRARVAVREDLEQYFTRR